MQGLLHLDEKKNILRTPWQKQKTSKKVTFLKGPNRGVKNIFFKFFLNRGVIRTHKRGCAKFAPFWMKNKYLCTPGKRVKRAKNHILKGSK